MPTFTYNGGTVFTPVPESTDMATQAELDAVATAKQDASAAATDAELAAALELKADAATTPTTSDLEAVESDLTDHMADTAVHSSGRELGFAAFTTNTTTTSASEADISGLSATVTVGDRPVSIRFNAPFVSNNAASGGAQFGIYRGTALLKYGYHLPLVAGAVAGVTIEARDAPAAGQHTYKIRWNRVTAGTATLTGSIGTGALLQVHEA